jgi:hypothetical protein
MVIPTAQIFQINLFWRKTEQQLCRHITVVLLLQNSAVLQFSLTFAFYKV